MVDVDLRPLVLNLVAMTVEVYLRPVVVYLVVDLRPPMFAMVELDLRPLVGGPPQPGRRFGGDGRGGRGRGVQGWRPK